MRLMLGLDHGDGETRFDGRRFRDIDQPLREIGTMIEGLPFHPTRRARDHLRMLAAASSVPARRVDEVLGLVGLSEVARKKPRGFSLGMAQRLGLAAALLGDPHTLILDEPANGLDPQGIQWLRDLLKMLGSEGRTVFVSSHLLSEMALMADELIVIGRGKIIAAGTVDLVRQRLHAHDDPRPQPPDRRAPAGGDVVGAGGRGDPQRGRVGPARRRRQCARG